MGMNITELFRETFKVWLEIQPRGTQTRIADQIGISRQFMSDFVKGRKNLSEEKRFDITKYTGFTYVEFLRMGEDIFDEELAWETQPYLIFKTIDIDKNRLEEIIKTVEATEAMGGGKLTPTKKAELIVGLYENQVKEEEGESYQDKVGITERKAEIFEFMKYKKKAA